LWTTKVNDGSDIQSHNTAVNNSMIWPNICTKKSLDWEETWAPCI